MTENQYIAYSDESKYTDGRYRGIGLVSLSVVHSLIIKEEILRILEESNIKELKWNKLRGAKERFAAIKLLKYTFDNAILKKLRIDVLSWDTLDTRHRVNMRHDIRNLERMYYHLFKNVLNKRWTDNALWTLNPDENSAIDWNTMRRVLSNSSEKKVLLDFDDTSDFSTQLVQEFKLKNIIPSSSEKEPFIQLADLFVGLSLYSRDSYKKYMHWQNINSPQQTLSLFTEASNIELSKADNQRCLVLSELDLLSRKNQPITNFKNNNGLRTLNPNEPINFWWYEPQSPHDKAPTRSK